MTELKINEFFYSIQGEGVRVGRPSLFIRTNGCNMRCIFRDSNGDIKSRCDTPYTSFFQEKNNISTEDVIEWYKYHNNIEDIVITGGEPLLNQEGLVNLIKELTNINRNAFITIETNGTIEPINSILEYVDLWSVSPKLKNSIPKPEDSTDQFPISKANCDYHSKNRINIKALSIFTQYYNHQLKFVWNGEQSTQEIKDIISELTEYNNNEEGYNIMLMPEGMTVTGVNKNTQDCVQECLDNGWVFTPRLHILVWGDKRGV